MSTIFTYVLVTLATIFWGANFNLSKPVVAEMDPLTAAAARFIIAAFLIGLCAAMKREYPAWRKNLGAYLLLGLVGIGGFNLLFFIGMQMTSAVNGALIMALNPLITSLIAYFAINEKLSLKQWLALPVGLAGVCFVLLGGGAQLHINTGDVLMLGACTSWAAYNVLCRRWMPKDTSNLANISAIMTAGALVLSLAALIHHPVLKIPSLYAGSALMLMILGGTVLAYLFWNMGITRFGAARTALFMNLIPVVSMLISSASGTAPSAPQLIGGAIVIGAVLFSNLSISTFTRIKTTT